MENQINDIHVNSGYKTILDATGKKAFLKLPSDLMRELVIKSNTTNYTERDKEELEIITAFFEDLNALHKTPTNQILKFHQSLALFLEIVRKRLNQNTQHSILFVPEK